MTTTNDDYHARPTSLPSYQYSSDSSLFNNKSRASIDLLLPTLNESDGCLYRSPFRVASNTFSSNSFPSVPLPPPALLQQQQQQPVVDDMTGVIQQPHHQYHTNGSVSMVSSLSPEQQGSAPRELVNNSTTSILNDQDQFPRPLEFDSIVQDYLQNLSTKKRDKALVDRQRYELILQVLKDPRNTAISTAQFRFWVKKMFQLVTADKVDVVCHDNKPVAMREHIYGILVRAHREVHHGGRDKTSALVRKRYSWIPKELIARFVRHCPFCITRRNGCQSPTLVNATSTTTNSESNTTIGTNHQNHLQYPDTPPAYGIATTSETIYSSPPLLPQLLHQPSSSTSSSNYNSSNNNSNNNNNMMTQQKYHSLPDMQQQTSCWNNNTNNNNQHEESQHQPWLYQTMHNSSALLYSPAFIDDASGSTPSSPFDNSYDQSPSACSIHTPTAGCNDLQHWTHSLMETNKQQHTYTSLQQQQQQQQQQQHQQQQQPHFMNNAPYDTIKEEAYDSYDYFYPSSPTNRNNSNNTNNNLYSTTNPPHSSSTIHHNIYYTTLSQQQQQQYSSFRPCLSSTSSYQEEDQDDSYESNAMLMNNNNQQQQHKQEDRSSVKSSPTTVAAAAAAAVVTSSSSTTPITPTYPSSTPFILSHYQQKLSHQQQDPLFSYN